MPEIQVLPKNISELIAAGEVIERPASVLKELTENAIDSGARHITAELGGGGVRFLRVTDDGCGIAPEQVRTAFLRHATSKIHEEADLDSIFTLGFRGEALASICAVSRTEILTRRTADEYGTHLSIEGGEETVFEQSGCPAGTTVIVRNLFYNVPVRAGFLKKDTAEGSAAATVFQKAALSHPEISFRLIRENRTEFVTPGDGQLFSAIHAVYGGDFARDLLPVRYEESEAGGISVSGYIMKPLYARPNRSHQLFFVNGRPVRAFVLMTALEEAFQTLVMTGKYPACVLCITLPPRTVDVNMHPTKAEVRFSDERRVGNAVRTAALQALHSAHLIYEFQLPQEKAEQPVTAEQMLPPKPKRDWFAPLPESFDSVPVPGRAFTEQTEPEKAADVLPENRPVTLPENRPVTLPEQHPAPAKSPVPAVPVTQESAPGAEAVPPQTAPVQTPAAPAPSAPAGATGEGGPITVIGELFDTYILAEAAGKFVMIDKHAAHERILFEQFRRRECRERQTLLTPAKILLTADEIDAVQNRLSDLEACGFSLDFSEAPVIQLTGVPLSCADIDLDELAAALAEGCLRDVAEPDRHLLDDKFHDLACKAAIRGGDHNTREELQSLAEQVWNDERIRHCPHGRPVMFLLTKYQIERQFQRLQH